MSDLLRKKKSFGNVEKDKPKELYVHCRACLEAGKMSNLMSVRYSDQEVVVDCLGCGKRVIKFARK